MKESTYIFMYAEATDKDLIHIRLQRGRREEVGREDPQRSPARSLALSGCPVKLSWRKLCDGSLGWEAGLTSVQT